MGKTVRLGGCFDGVRGGSNGNERIEEEGITSRKRRTDKQRGTSRTKTAADRLKWKLEEAEEKTTRWSRYD